MGTVSPSQILSGSASVGAIKGGGAASDFEGQVVTASGLVRAIDSVGFYPQDSVGDADDATQRAFFVFADSAPTAGSGTTPR